MLRILIAILLILPCPTTVRAATLITGKDPRCALELAGPIEDGDAARLVALIETSSGDTTSICLDSPGGSLKGGMELYDVFMAYGVATYLREGDSCLSACALAFLGGSEWGDYRYNSRRMEPGAQLGFVAPMPAATDLLDPATALERSYDILRRLVRDQRMSGLSTDFLTDVLMAPSDQPHMVDTLGRAAHAGVDLVLPPDAVQANDMGQVYACAMAFELYKDTFRSPDSDFEPLFELQPDGEFAMSLVMSQVTIDGEVRDVVSSRHAWGTPWLTSSCAFGPATPGEDYIEATLWTNFIAEESSFANALRVMRVGVPAWYLIAPDTALSGL
ncbi:hypothetical protein [Maliponia aquimaris]|uniref:Periplasmic protein-like protein n=1 Tax=Maliponia aquimaris TaxID=1673631 RepID=A0A238L704_9RHOB|nr:hypothetical protein [Maliponia aquimaris]SMX50778.1 hypothetical protein MAA8898_04985 [Maliponia aquimaris]